MFRLALFGIACLAVAAYTLVRIPAKNTQDCASDQMEPEDQGRLGGYLTPILARGFHAKFSVN